MTNSYELDDVTRFVVDAIGEPGHRVFLIQIVAPRHLLTLKTEKQSVRLLGDRISTLLEDITDFGHLPDDLNVTAPLDIDWETGSIAVEWNISLERFAIEIGSARWDPATLPDDDRDSFVSFRVTKEQAGAFAIKARLLVESGRPPCPLCGYPLDAEGHACPRTNGHRPPSL